MKCKICKKEFEGHPRAEYCSDECYKKQRALEYLKIREARLEYQKVYYLENRDRITEYQNSDKFRETNRRSYHNTKHKNREKINKRQREKYIPIQNSKRRRWTTLEIKTLLEKKSEGLGYKQIATDLNRSVQACVIAYFKNKN